MLGVGKIFNEGQRMARPGGYLRYYNDGDFVKMPPKGEVFAVITSEVGSIEEPITVNGIDDVYKLLGKGHGAEVVHAAFKGGALKVHVARAGTGGKEAEFTGLKAGVEIKTLYPTGSDIRLENKVNLTGGNKLSVFAGTTLLEVIPYDNAYELDDYDSKHLLITVAEGTEGAIFDDVSVSAKGEAPTVDEAAYIAALPMGELVFWDTVITDSEEDAVMFAIQTFTNRMLRDGRRVFTTLACKPKAKISEKLKSPKKFNDFTTLLVGNGFKAQNKEFIGSTAAAFLAGLIVSKGYTYNLSLKVIPGAVEIIQPFDNAQYDEAADNGLIVFAYNRNRDVKVDYGISTLTSPDDINDYGWRSIRRMRTRYELFDRIMYQVEATLERGRSMSDDDLKHIITIGNGVINDMIQEGGLRSGEMILDPLNKPEGDSAWFTFENLEDLDGLNKAYIAFPFKY